MRRVVMFSKIPMHIPDGFLSVLVSAILWVVSIVFIAIALKQVDHELNDRKVPLMGVMAAAIFAGQMLNFAIAGGTSGHLLGAALAVILLGPWTAQLVMTSVVVIQAVIFQDGGIIALGANLFNMAVLGVSVAHFIFSLVMRVGGERPWARITGSFAAGWFSIFIASLAAGLQLAASGTSPAHIAIPAMGGIHALIGIGEGLITTAAISLILAAKPEILLPGQKQRISSKGIWIIGMIFTLALIALSPLASAKPDGLEWVAEELGFISLARDAAYQIIPDYVMPGIHNESLATILAGIIGVMIVISVLFSVSCRKRHSGTA
jgi:cobalt/nickel transport system permease protein